ncbi:hypothetical protein JCM24511_10091 [Saitozyma sp. JCM 24511]|nr:hypothetical protein JCM24511_10091 [Saitozyma sp. JCM 24511]
MPGEVSGLKVLKAAMMSSSEGMSPRHRNLRPHPSKLLDHFPSLEALGLGPLGCQLALSLLR